MDRPTTDGPAGYSKGHWDRLEAEKQRETQRLLHGTPPRSQSPIKDAASPSESALPITKKKISVCLRGEWGQIKMKAADFVTFSVLAQYYCQKHDKPLHLAAKLKLVFDGDVMAPESTVSEAEMDEGDMIDVEV